MKKLFALALAAMMILSSLSLSVLALPLHNTEVESAQEIYSSTLEDARGSLSEDSPKFEKLEFMSSALTDWKTGVTFSPDVTEYDLTVKTYSTTKLTIMSTTRYNSELYSCTASFTDSEGENREIAISSAKLVYLDKIPFGKTKIDITLYDKSDENNKTVYTFEVTRPRDTTKNLKNTTGAVLSIPDRNLSATKYDGYSEGVFLRTDDSFENVTGSGISASVCNYITYLQQSADKFTLSLTGTTVYTHLRYSVGNDWKYFDSTGVTDVISIPSEKDYIDVEIQVLDDAAYFANTLQGKDGFEDSQPMVYIIRVVKTDADGEKAVITDANTDFGDLYPHFDSESFTYTVVVPYDTAVFPDVSFTASENATVKLGTELLTPDENGRYNFTLKTSAQTINVTDEDGKVSNSYSVKAMKKSKYDVPDRVVDYMCVGSQYTNASYGIQPETTLAGSMKSLGNFGGYITFYYEKPLVDDPNNKYGVDFYVYGNSFSDGGSAAEPGQVYVSEDGETWYALAGSEHYENNAHKNYTITYKKGADGKSYWTDSLGNKMANSATNFPSKSIYPYCNALTDDSYSYTGICFDSAIGGIMGDGSTSSFGFASSFGYCDYFANGTIGADVNPYLANSTKSNGFDLCWAVDENDLPVDVSDMEFHYVRAATASNIWAGSFGEKSTEISYVVRTTPDENNVGITENPEGIIISDGAEKIVVKPTEGKNVYQVNVGNMKYIKISVDGKAYDNVYVNNRRLADQISSDTFRVTKKTNQLVRVILQDGEKTPELYVLSITGTAPDEDGIIEGIKIGADGNVRSADRKSDKSYSASVGYGISSFALYVTTPDGVTTTVNGSELLESYDLDVGKNTFEILGTDENGLTQEVKLTVNRAKAPSVSQKTIDVYFSLYGDENHNDSVSHTYAKNKSDLENWVKKCKVTLPYGSTVLDVIQKSLDESDIEYVNAGGNYISSVNGLSEFDNGELSGWLYSVNGIYPDLGVSEKTVKSGDSIVLHYTDDYTKEKSSEAFASTSSAKSDDTDNTKEEKPDLKLYDTEKLITETADFLYKTETSPSVGTVGGEWLIFGLSRSGKLTKDFENAYTTAFSDYLRDCDGVLSQRKNTEYSRVVIALSSLGKNAANVCGYDLTLPLFDYDATVKQGINGAIFALISLEGGKVSCPDGLCDKYVEFVLSRQNPDGGFSITADGESDVDITAMALVSLIGHIDEQAVKESVEKALSYLSLVQNSDGGYSGSGSENLESCAQVLTALCTYDIDVNDPRFVKNGFTVVDALLSFRLSDGSFAHIKSDFKTNLMSTEQGLYSLAALDRYSSEKTALYDMSDVQIEQKSDSSGLVRLWLDICIKTFGFIVK